MFEPGDKETIHTMDVRVVPDLLEDSSNSVSTLVGESVLSFSLMDPTCTGEGGVGGGVGGRGSDPDVCHQVDIMPTFYPPNSLSSEAQYLQDCHRYRKQGKKFSNHTAFRCYHCFAICFCFRVERQNAAAE